MWIRLATLLLAGCGLVGAASKTLDVYFVDVEGGQATLVVSPSGESLLIDTGWPGFQQRDAKRIVAVAHAAGLKQIDNLLITHFHVDHAGGVPQLAALIPIRNFIDHGESIEKDEAGNKLYHAYLEVRDKGKHMEAVPGTMLPLSGVNAEVVTAAGKRIDKPLPGAGAANPHCAETRQKDADPTENAQSVGTFFTFGKFRMVDLGDLTWNKEFDLMCPVNRLGTADVYVVTHHGMDMSGTPAMVAGLNPRVAIMDNGAKKGGTVEAWDTIHHTKTVQDIWQVHRSIAGGDAHNAPEKFIANLEATPDEGHYLKLSAKPDGSFSVTNGRTGWTKEYPAR